MNFLGDNIKVHFAGSDGSLPYHLALKSADVKYRLYSVYPFIEGKRKDESLKLPDDHILKIQEKEMKHVIQDSGLFTLMFGAGKNRKVDHDFLVDWQDKLIQFVIQNNLNCTCVEIDCQKLLGAEEAWFFRKRMKKTLPNRQINVFHFEDGKAGLDKLIDFSDYIAFSVPELRIIKPKTYKEDAVRIAKYAKKKKPTIDIHMLGCTENKILADTSFCTSADSTSWLSGVRYGYFADKGKRGHINHFKKKVVQNKMNQISDMAESFGEKIKPSVLRTTAQASICATICKNKYTEAAGNQD